jgi:hypothetical protein
VGDNAAMATLKTTLPANGQARQLAYWLAGLYVVAYVALDWLSYIQPVGPLPITPWIPPRWV